MDDFLLFADDKATLWHWEQAIEQRLARLRLQIHPGAQPQPVSEGFPFLGFTVFPQRRRLKRSKGIHFQRKLRRLLIGYTTRRDASGTFVCQPAGLGEPCPLCQYHRAAQGAVGETHPASRLNF